MEEWETAAYRQRLMHLLELRVMVSRLYPNTPEAVLDREVAVFMSTLEKLSAVTP